MAEIFELQEDGGGLLPISSDTIVRTILLFVTLINAIGAIFGWNPLEVDQAALYQGVSAAAVVVTAIWSWWKNNSFTQEAIKADIYKDELKGKHFKEE